MDCQHSLTDFCQYVLEGEGSALTDEPVRLAAAFREYFNIRSTPTLEVTINLVRRLGIRVEAVDYLPTGGTNMAANGLWYIHYSSKDRPATQKFTIFHELFEIIDKTFKTVDRSHARLKEPQLSRYADRFAAAALIPPDFFMRQMVSSGCDIARLSEELELSHQCLLIALAEHLADMPVVGALYECYPARSMAGPLAVTRDFVATVVVRTLPARWVRQLCPMQAVPTRDSRPSRGSLVCAAITGGRPVLWQETEGEGYPVVLVRPLLWAGLEPYRVILLALPSGQYNMLSPQVERIQPVKLEGADSCPFTGAHADCNQCANWNIKGGYNE